jgi:hypothetical protein
VVGGWYEVKHAVAVVGMTIALLTVPLGTSSSTAATSLSTRTTSTALPVAAFEFDFHLLENENTDRELGQYAARSHTSLNFFPVIIVIVLIGSVFLWIFNR